MTTGILALQGAFIEHKRKLESLGETCFEIRQLSDMQRPFDRLVLPGGESTTQAKLLHDLGLFKPLREHIAASMPVLATCAGLILLAEHVEGTGDLLNLNPAAANERLQVIGLATLPITVQRNGYGRQLASFRTQAEFSGLSIVPMTFIRAPKITCVGEGVEVLASIDDAPVAVRYGNQLGLAFHPELDADNRIHEMFLEI
jgi:pyridoxal 5'-phosphate synthase pdxT subunit